MTSPVLVQCAVHLIDPEQRCADLANVEVTVESVGQVPLCERCWEDLKKRTEG